MSIKRKHIGRGTLHAPNPKNGCKRINLDYLKATLLLLGQGCVLGPDYTGCWHDTKERDKRDRVIVIKQTRSYPEGEPATLVDEYVWKNDLWSLTWTSVGMNKGFGMLHRGQL